MAAGEPALYRVDFVGQALIEARSQGQSQRSGVGQVSVGMCLIGLLVTHGELAEGLVPSLLHLLLHRPKSAPSQQKQTCF
jgi:hypothetical protein